MVGGLLSERVAELKRFMAKMSHNPGLKELRLSYVGPDDCCMADSRRHIVFSKRDGEAVSGGTVAPADSLAITVDQQWIGDSRGLEDIERSRNYQAESASQGKQPAEKVAAASSSYWLAAIALVSVLGTIYYLFR
jgi:hypothetical protein